MKPRLFEGGLRMGWRPGRIGGAYLALNDRGVSIGPADRLHRLVVPASTFEWAQVRAVEPDDAGIRFCLKHRVRWRPRWMYWPVGRRVTFLCSKQDWDDAWRAIPSELWANSR